MGGFFGVAAKEDCVFDLFFGTDYHPIWEPDVPAWQSTAKKKVTTEPFTT